MDKFIDRVKIGIVGMGHGAGTGFMAICLARALVKLRNCHPAVVELGQGGLFDCLGMDKHFSEQQYFSFHKAVKQDRSIRCRSNEVDGVNWMLIPPGETDYSQDLDSYRKLRLVNNGLGDVIICRLKGLEGEELWRLLWEMDRVLVVIDPLPSRMLAGYEFLCSLRVCELPITYIINKYNKGVNRKELLDYLRLKKLIYLPLVEQEAVYAGEYICRPVYDIPVVEKQLKKPMKDLIEEILP